MTTFQPFDMERMMSKWENAVDYNLSESGVHPMSIRGLVDDAAVIEELLTTELICADTGCFQAGKWAPGRRLNGDETAHGTGVLLGEELQAIRFSLHSYR